MSVPVRVLIIDDSQDDTLLLIDELRDDGFEPDYLRVDTPEDMTRALSEQTWDIIIADYKMPRFSGPHALQILHESRLDIPFILVSGTAEENTGVDMMRAGAQDFIVKHRISRLVPAITRELAEAEVRKQRKHALETARVSAENYRTMFDYAPVAIVAYDGDAVILQVNPMFEQLFGFSAEEITGRRIWDTFGLPENAEKTRDVVACIFAGEVVRNAEYELRRKDGTLIYVLANITPVYNEHGEIIMALSMNTDITERKMAEQRERERETRERDFYRRTILAATDGKLFISDREEINSIACSHLGSWSVRNVKEMSAMRDDITLLVREAGMEESRLYEFLGCVVEAAGNAIKHADGGTSTFCRNTDSVVYTIADSGPGIRALALPDVALVKGYSTAGTLGMGYKIMIKFADRVYLSTGPEGTIVAIEMKLHAGPSESNFFLRKPADE